MKPELLSPAGNRDAFIAAINCGCDAIYCGIGTHGARASAKNIAFEELDELLDYAHIRGVKVYAVFNVLYSDGEIQKVINDILIAWNAGIDAIIVQDIGVLHLLRTHYPDITVHISTQMSIYNLYGARLLERLGACRVVLARETELPEYRCIKENLSIETECFAHGALCVCISGQCLMSSMIGKRSGNRGACAQPCRKKYKIISPENIEVPNVGYFLSPYDLNTVSKVSEYAEYGVDSIKLEGRLKSPEYVALVTNAYRKAIDETVDEQDVSSMRQIFNRGETLGINRGRFGKNFISRTQPSHIGVEIGKIVSINKNAVSFLFDHDVKKGDSIAYISESGQRSGIKLEKDVLCGEIYKAKIKDKVRVGTAVFRSASVEANAYAHELINIERNTRIIDFKIQIAVGEPIKARITDGTNVFELSDGEVVQSANKNPIDYEFVYSAFSKLGASGFAMGKFELEISEGAFLPKSALNAMRRELVEGLSKKIASSFKHDETVIDMLLKESSNTKKSVRGLALAIDGCDDLNGVDVSSVSRVYGDFTTADITKLREIGGFQIIMDCGILFKREQLEAALDKYKSHDYDGVYVNDFSAFEFFKSNGCAVYGGAGLNVTNESSIKFLENIGARSACISYEVDLKRMKSFEADIELELNVFGRVPVMTTRSCPAALVKGCINDKGCENCKYKRGYKLSDERNYEFEFERMNEHTVIYNSLPLLIDDKIALLSNIDVFRLDLRGCRYKDFIVRAYSRLIEESDEEIKKEIEKTIVSFTRGHFFDSMFEV